MTEFVPHLVSTIIPVYNRPELLQDAVRSVLAQTWRPIEILIVNDGSTDGAGEAADALAREHPDKIKVLHRTNQGPGPSREAGREIARGEFIQYLDSDDLLMPDKFERQVKALFEQPGCDIASGITRLVDRDGKVLDPVFKWTGESLSTLFPGLLVDRWWCTHTPLYRRSLCDRVGPWSSLRYSQDWEYDARAGALNAQIAHVDALVSEHRQHSGVRQTGHGRWLIYPDQVQFFRTLLACAKRAGVPDTASEFRHFSRWVFSQTRKCALEGDVQSSRALLQLALEASTPVSKDLRVFQGASRMLGLRVAARLFTALRQLRPGLKSRDTLSFSWARPKDETSSSVEAGK